MSADLSELYQQVILDHNKRPRNRGKLPTANRVAHGDNPTCGDQCSVYLRLVPDAANGSDRIAEISFDGSGCAISQASASLMTTQVKGKSGAEVDALYQQFHEIVTTGNAPEEISDLAAFAGVHAFPARIKCATLGWHAAIEALKGGPEVTTETHTD
ncbi:MAG: SUF system NifU family Fe-S cluster assembly protein [Verrucomicrobia bacterium]|nr:SUF system NifU family Fe-S cluster assembly protein [Verrucomicrobiota bacterium]